MLVVGEELTLLFGKRKKKGKLPSDPLCFDIGMKHEFYGFLADLIKTRMLCYLLYVNLYLNVICFNLCIVNCYIYLLINKMLLLYYT